MVQTGLEQITRKLPSDFKGKRIGLLCHSSSVSSDFRHITDIFFKKKECKLTAIFGPQHGLYGQTQDNMVEWESKIHPFYKIPVYSLYGEYRKPSSEMLGDIDILVVDLQDVGARLYTYVWTLKLCLEACAEANIPVWVLDRPNPIGMLPYDGPVLKEEFFTFVGGASVPMCHRMTIGEMAVLIKDRYFKNCTLRVVWMKDWKRNTLYSETGIPWVLPSPNMPTLSTAIVYPGNVLMEALNISEARGTTIPFELFGAPFINPESLKSELDSRRIPGCVFRIHGFIPTFNKFAGQYCNGLQIHVTNPSIYYPVSTTLEIIDAIIKTSPENSLKFNLPPYEYEYRLMPFDILSGDSFMRKALIKRDDTKYEKLRWKNEIEQYMDDFKQFSVYPE
jgi:uncharacterized protein YbbC (DUF1343 family)